MVSGIWAVILRDQPLMVFSSGEYKQIDRTTVHLECGWPIMLLSGR